MPVRVAIPSELQGTRARSPDLTRNIDGTEPEAKLGDQTASVTFSLVMGMLCIKGFSCKAFLIILGEIVLGAQLVHGARLARMVQKIAEILTKN